jgi:hypothetical protein
MGPNPNGGHSSAPAGERLNVFALVVYIPDPLGGFLDGLRKELVPACQPHAHVSVLPPRPLAVEWRRASEQVRAVLEAWPPFEIALTGIRVFPVTDVVYIDIGSGAAELCRMHAAMDAGWLAFEEPFGYSPHITLAQEFPHQQLPEIHQLARRRWSEYRGPRSFLAKQAMFVRNTLSDAWIDLAEYSLGTVVAR